MSRRRWFCALLLLFAGATARESRADGLISDGLGAISLGRGGTNIAFADNGAVINDNPGALVNVAGNGLLDLETDTVITQLHYTDPKPNNVQSHTRPVPTPNLGFIKRSKDGRW